MHLNSSSLVRNESCTVRHPSEYTTEQLVLLTTLVTMITLMMWFMTDLTGVQRVTSMGFVIVAATVGTLVGFELFGWPE